MAEVWVSMLSCSECLRHHDPDYDDPGDCDCWCHDGDTDLDDEDDFIAYLPEGRVQDMLRNPDNRHLY